MFSLHLAVFFSISETIKDFIIKISTMKLLKKERSSKCNKLYFDICVDEAEECHLIFF